MKTVTTERSIYVNYDNVDSTTTSISSHTFSRVVAPVNDGHREVDRQLMSSDGAVIAMFTEVINANLQKALAMAGVLQKLTRFISVSSAQIEINEQRMASAMSGTRR